MAAARYRTRMSCRQRPVRLLLIPGLYGSDAAHWQSWLQSLFRGSLRVEQDDWAVPDLAAWSRRIGEVVTSDPHAQWVGVAHSFGCLALAHYLGRQADAAVAAALFVAPAEPDRFRVGELLPQAPLPVPSTVLASRTDPWIKPERAAEWARRWGSGYTSLRDAGHINTAAGFGPLPIAKRMTEALMRHADRRRLAVAELERAA